MNETVIKKEEVKFKNISNKKMKKVAKEQIAKTEFPEVVVDLEIVKKLLEENKPIVAEEEIPTEGVPINESIPNINELYGIQTNDEIKKSRQDLRDDEDRWIEEKEKIRTDKVLNILLGASLTTLVVIVGVAIYLGLQLFGII